MWRNFGSVCFWGWRWNNCSCVSYAVGFSFLKEDLKRTRRGIWIPNSCSCPSRPSQSHRGSFLGHVLVWAFLSVLGGKNISWQCAHSMMISMTQLLKLLFLAWGLPWCEAVGGRERAKDGASSFRGWRNLDKVQMNGSFFLGNRP